MPQPLDYVEYLSKEIGARPAGTEEEQQAALYIADEFQKEAGFTANIEDFTSSSNLEGGRAILAMITIVVSILAMLFNILTIPALVLALIAAVIYVLEAYDKPIISSRLARGASQNVVAKYQPFGEGAEEKRGARRRKIVLIAHYDTGKVTPGIIQRAESMNLPLSKVCLAGMVAAPFFLLLRLFLGGTGGAGLIFINLLTIIAIILVAMPIVKAILYRVAPYNEGANNNATGVAALLEIAQRINSGSLSEADLLADEGEAVVHGERAARAEGLVPDDAQLNYEAEMTDEEFDNASEEERLLAAKAAIAALTGRPIDQHIYATPAPKEQYEEPEYAYEDYSEPSFDDIEEAPVVESAFAPIDPAAFAPAVEEDVSGFENAPSWFVAAQRNAKKSESAKPIQKSRYTEAIQAAEQQLAEREREREEEERAARAKEQLEREAASRAALAAMVEAPAEPEPENEFAARPEQPTFEDVVAVEDAQADETYQPRFEAFSTAADADEGVSVDVGEGMQAEPDFEQPEEADDTKLPAKMLDEDADEALEIDSSRENMAGQTGLTLEPIQNPGTFEDRLADEPKVDLGQTIAFTPAMLRQAIQEELKDEIAEVMQDDEPAQEEQEAAQDNLDNSARLRLQNLPLVDGQDKKEGVPENTNPSRSGLFRMLRTDVPSLSGIISPIPVSEPERGSLLESSQLPKITVEADHSDVDYSMEIPVVVEKKPAKIDVPAVFDESETEEPADGAQSAATPAPGQVEVPKSRAGGFLNRIRNNEGAELKDTPQEWLNVDDDFEAREVGRERGSWESFRDEESNANGRKWEGGAFSRIRLGHVDTRSGVDEEEDPIQEAIEATEDHELNEEIEQIYHFRNPDFDAEIWFVAIGSDTELHDGARAFVEEHKHELRGAMVIELESLGVGELCVASEEGQFRKMQASSRIKRFTRGAAEATGIVLGQIKLATDSITTVMQKSGLQAMHILGVEDGRPALKGSADDIYENVDELIFEENINYIVELLKQD